MAIDKNWIENILNSRSSSEERESVRFVTLPKKGSISFHMLPDRNTGKPGMLVYNIYNLPKNEDGDKTYCQCVEKTHPESGVDCPVLEVLEKLKSMGVDIDRWKPSGAAYIKALIVEGEGDDRGPFNPYKPVILRMTEYSLIWLVKKFLDPDYGDFTNPEHSAVIKFSRAGEKMKWEREFKPKWKPIAPTSEEIDEIMEQADKINIEKFFGVPSEDTMRKIKKQADQLFVDVCRTNDLIHTTVQGQQSELEFKSNTNENVDNLIKEQISKVASSEEDITTDDIDQYIS